MEDEPQPGRPTRPTIDRTLTGLVFIWLGLLLGAATFLGTLVLIVLMGASPRVNDEVIVGIFMAASPIALGVYVLAPQLSQRPSVVNRAEEAASAVAPQPEDTPPDDPASRMPVYASRFFVRMGVLDGAIIFSAVGFLVTENWVLLFETLPLFALMLLCRPSRAGYRSWVAGLPGGGPEDAIEEM